MVCGERSMVKDENGNLKEVRKGTTIQDRTTKDYECRWCGFIVYDVQIDECGAYFSGKYNCPRCSHSGWKCISGPKRHVNVEKLGYMADDRLFTEALKLHKDGDKVNLEKIVSEMERREITVVEKDGELWFKR